MNNKIIKISLVLNILIFILTVLSLVIMFTGFKFMHGNDLVLQTSKIGMFKFFTVDSNLFMGIIALIFSIKEIKLLKGNTKEISTFYYILKLIATTSVALTFVVVFAYLGPIAKYGILSLLMNSNLFLHLIIPLLSIFTFIFFEKTDTIKIKHIFYSIVPTILYGIYYVTNILIHMSDGKVSPIYDWYYFVQNGVSTAIIVVPLMLLITYIIGLLLYVFNKIGYKRWNNEKAVYVDDTLKDYKAATVANIPFIQCLYGFGKELDCEYKIDDISKLNEVVDNLLNK